MNRQEAAALIDRYLQGKATSAEEALVQYWFAKESGKDEVRVNAEYNVHAEMWAVIAHSIEAPKIAGKPKFGKAYRISVAVAAAIMTIALCIYFFSAPNDREGYSQRIKYASDVAPGVSGATLTLAGGQKIRLYDAKNGELAQEAGVVITKSADGELVYEVKDKGDDRDKINTLSTAKGETYKLRLPDGSLVYLNAASSLTYTACLNERGKRVVRLSGEGFFDIAKDKAHPFVVKTANQEVEVLGTHFNVNAYADEPVVSTTLLEGSVKLVSGNQDKVLKPGQVALNGGSGIKVSVANVEAVTDWKNEEFFLDKMDFRTAMRKLARWYNIEVIYNGSVPDNLETGGWIPRSSKLSDVLKAIESSGLAKFKIEGRKVYVSK